MATHPCMAGWFVRVAQNLRLDAFVMVWASSFVNENLFGSWDATVLADSRFPRGWPECGVEERLDCWYRYSDKAPQKSGHSECEDNFRTRRVFECSDDWPWAHLLSNPVVCRLPKLLSLQKNHLTRLRRSKSNLGRPTQGNVQPHSWPPRDHMQYRHPHVLHHTRNPKTTTINYR
jgi:hypothetical protein